MKKILYILTFIFCAYTAQAQNYILVKDTAFARAISEFYPNIMDTSNTKIDTVLAKNVSGDFNLDGWNTISHIDELQYFYNISLFRLTNSKVDSVPDISNLTNLNNLSLGSNNIHYLPDISNLTSLTFLYIYANELDTIRGIENHPSLTTVMAFSNKFQYIPNLNTLPNLDTASFTYNKLTWQSIIDKKDILDFENTVQVFPQGNLTSEKIFQVLENESFTFNYNYFEGTESVYMQILKNGSDEVFSDATNRTFIIKNTSLSDAGTYKTYFYSDLSEFTGKSFNTGNTILEVIPCEENVDSIYISKTINYPFSNIIIDSIDATVSNVDYDYIFTNGTEIYKTSIGNVTEIPTGTYNIQLTTQGGCLVIFPDALSVEAYQKVSNISFNKDISCDKLEITLTSYTLEKSYDNVEFDFYITNSTFKHTLNLNSPQPLEEGVYELHITDHFAYDSILVDSIAFFKPQTCEQYFSPNHDGENDLFYIGSDGPINIVNRKGIEVATFTGPMYWDGKNNNGIDLPIGVYKINTSKEVIIISIIR